MKIEREQVIKRLWELANVSAEETKGSITGQLKALELLLQLLPAVPAVTTPKVAPFYRAAWMDLPTPDKKM